MMASTHHNRVGSTPNAPPSATAANTSATAVDCDKLRNGSIVDIKASYSKNNFQGEVIAYDEACRILILKCQNGEKKTDVRLVNMTFVMDLSIVREANTSNSPQMPQTLNMDKLYVKARKNIEERERLARAMAAGVSADGINVFLAIRKTIDDVTWQDKTIIVMNSVAIYPPYKPENCTNAPASGGKDAPETQSVFHVRKIVEKHLKDSAATAFRMTNHNNSVPATASSSSSSSSLNKSSTNNSHSTATTAVSSTTTTTASTNPTTAGTGGGGSGDSSSTGGGLSSNSNSSSSQHCNSSSTSNAAIKSSQTGKQQNNSHAAPSAPKTAPAPTAAAATTATTH